MYQGKHVSVVVLAAGRGSRMQADLNKQYIVLGGMPVVTRTLLVLEQSALVDEIVVVVAKGEEVYCKQIALEPYSISKVKQIVVGGAQRQDSCYLGLQAVKEADGYVLFHDGARPFFTEKLLQDALCALETYDACCVAVPVKDTIKRVSEEGVVVETPQRSTLYAAQTPQGFRIAVAREVYAKAVADGFIGTDDSQLAEKYGYASKFVCGSYENIKITTKEDLHLGEAILKMRGGFNAGGISESNS